ncbi:MAG: hypothetical protein GY838_03215 [bacterium]|nr:hypothetical protein [bacterium]
MLFRGFTLMCLVVLAAPVAADDRDTLNDFLAEGRIQDGLEAFASPTDNAGQFSLAALQAIDGVERFSGGCARLGVDPQFVMLGVPFLGVAPDLQPETAESVSPGQIAELFRSLQASLRQANTTLAGIDDEDFGVEIDLARARLDFDGDGVAADDETFLAVFERAPTSREAAEPAAELIVRFDSADAKWLQGYTHFAGGFLDILTAYDWRPVWDQCAHVVFLQPDPRPEIARWSSEDSQNEMFLDIIAAVHDLRLELRDEGAWRRAREQFQGMIACSRACWSRVLAETDDDREWLPSPDQTGPRGATITREQIDGWHAVLDELEAVTRGEKLLPHWRFRPGTGINVEKMVVSPPAFDLVLFIQGSAFLPYLEEGPVSDADVWNDLTSPFGPGFAGFAVWSN